MTTMLLYFWCFFMYTSGCEYERSEYDHDVDTKSNHKCKKYGIL